MSAEPFVPKLLSKNHLNINCPICKEKLDDNIYKTCSYEHIAVHEECSKLCNNKCPALGCESLLEDSKGNTTDNALEEPKKTSKSMETQRRVESYKDIKAAKRLIALREKLISKRNGGDKRGWITCGRSLLKRYFSSDGPDSLARIEVVSRLERDYAGKKSAWIEGDHAVLEFFCFQTKKWEICQLVNKPDLENSEWLEELMDYSDLILSGLKSDSDRSYKYVNNEERYQWR